MKIVDALTSVVMLAVLAACGPAALERVAYMPPDQFMHPFKGNTVVVPLPATSSGVSEAETKITLSQSGLRPSIATCIIRLPTTRTLAGSEKPPFPTTMLTPETPHLPREAWRISDNLRYALFLIELAFCNGAEDPNADPSRRFIPTGYERTAAQYDWKPVYDRLAPTATWVGVQQ